AVRRQTTGAEGGIQVAVGFGSRQPVLGHALGTGARDAADEDLTVGLQDHHVGGLSEATYVRRRTEEVGGDLATAAEAGVEGSVGGQARHCKLAKGAVGAL